MPRADRLEGLESYYRLFNGRPIGFDQRAPLPGDRMPAAGKPQQLDRLIYPNAFRAWKSFHANAFSRMNALSFSLPPFASYSRTPVYLLLLSCTGTVQFDAYPFIKKTALSLDLRILQASELHIQQYSHG